MAAPHACRADEERLFACNTGRKAIAVCASPGWTATRGTLQYRFGAESDPELVLPRQASTPASSATSGLLSFSGGGGAHLRFAGGKVDYVVYTAVNPSWGEKSGVAIEKGGKRLGNLRCRGKVESQLGEALFRKAGFQSDSKSFELP